MIYLGLFKDDKRHGEGMRYLDSNVYYYNYDNGKLKSKKRKKINTKNKKGYVKDKPFKKGFYSGPWNEDKQCPETLPGQVGIFEYEHENCYKGEFQNGLFEGEGYLSTNKFEYFGMFKNGLFEGKGSLRYANGKSYEGEFENGFRHGNGILIKESKTTTSVIISEGIFKNNYIKKGTIKVGDNSIFEGKFENGLLQGYGKYKDNAGNTYEGNFEDGLLQGYGKHTHNNGTIDEGEFKNNLPNGIIITKFKSGLEQINDYGVRRCKMKGYNEVIALGRLEMGKKYTTNLVKRDKPKTLSPIDKNI